MATKRRQVEILDETPVLELDDVMTGAQLSPALDKLCSELGIEGDVASNVYISLISPDEAKEARVWVGTPDEYDLMSVARKFGSGDYRVKIYVPSAKGNMVIRGNKIIPVLLDPAEDQRIARMRRGEQENPAIAPTGLLPADIVKLVVDAVKAAMPAPIAPVADPITQMKGLAEVMRALMPQAPAQNGANSLEVLKTAAEIAQSLGGANRDPIEGGSNATAMDVFLKLVDKFAPAIAEAVKPGLTKAIAAPGAEQPAAGQPPQEDQAVIQLRMGLQFLCSQAANGADPDTYAEVVLDSVPEESLQQLVNHADPIAYLAQFDKNVLLHKDWFEKLVKSVTEILTQPAESADPDVTQPGTVVDSGAKPA